MISSSTASISILIIAGIALIILLYQLRKSKRGRYCLERDGTGLWRYHRESQYQRQRAFENKLKKDKKGPVKKHKAQTPKPILVLNFQGDIRAKQHRSFAKLVDEAIVNRDELDEVVVVINSPGGMVSQYGHLYSQMERIRQAGLSLTACIDVVGASGGYLMSLPANNILAAPFAVVGSVGCDGVCSQRAQPANGLEY